MYTACHHDHPFAAFCMEGLLLVFMSTATSFNQNILSSFSFFPLRASSCLSTIKLFYSPEYFRTRTVCLVSTITMIILQYSSLPSIILACGSYDNHF